MVSIGFLRARILLLDLFFVVGLDFSDVKLLNSFGVVVDFAANTSMGKMTSL